MVLRILSNVLAMREYRDRLNDAMQDAGVSTQQLADAMGVSYQAVKKAQDGRSNAFSAANNAAAAKFLGVRSDWLASGVGSKRPHDHNVEPGPDLAPLPVPVISWVRAGDWCEAADDVKPEDAEGWLFITGHSRPRAFALRVRGVSMEPQYHEGDIILVDPDLRAVNGSHVVVRLDNTNEATFKRLVIEGERKFLQPLNPAWPDKMIEVNNNATICGVVFALHRDV